MYINKVLVFGNVTRDPDFRSLPNGGSVSTVGIATNRMFKRADGTKEESTEFHTIQVFGKDAESASQYLKKGMLCYVEGRLQTRTWEVDGKKSYKTEIISEKIQWVRSKPVDSHEE